MMGRILFWALLVLVAVWLLRGALSGRQAGRTRARSQPAPHQTMVVCRYCGVHLPEPEALKSAVRTEHYFCDEAHRLAFESPRKDTHTPSPP